VTVDPKVYALAESFVDDVLAEDVRNLSPRALSETYKTFKRALIQRAAEAMQQAIEQECEAIRQELQS